MLFILSLNWTQTSLSNLIEASGPNKSAWDKTPKIKNFCPSNDKQWYYKNVLKQQRA